MTFTTILPDVGLAEARNREEEPQYVQSYADFPNTE